MIAEKNRGLEGEAERITNEYIAYIESKNFPCIGAKAALAREQISCFIAGNMGCPKDDGDILNFLYKFISGYQNADSLYFSAAVVFKGPRDIEDDRFDILMWQRLQSLADMDAANYAYDLRVNADPSSPDFSFSLKEESLFIIGIHPASSRPARRFAYPALVFNPHGQFDRLRQSGKYEKMKEVMRKRDLALSGSINPMLRDFGDASEVYQYSGKQYGERWQCPLKINHATTGHNTSA